MYIGLENIPAGRHLYVVFVDCGLYGIEEVDVIAETAVAAGAQVDLSDFVDGAVLDSVKKVA